jgi:flagellar hook-associated protein 2
VGLRIDPAGGGQFKQAVQQIIEAERQPIKQIETRKGREEAKLKLLGEFRSKFANIDKALIDLAGFSTFRELKVDMGDGSTQASVTMDKSKAQPGSYQIQIDELAHRSSIISNGFESAEEPLLGVGFITMKLANGEETEIYVDDEESSLKGVAKMINQQDSPVRAAVVQDAGEPEKPWRLILTAKKDGSANAVAFPEFYFLDGSSDFYAEDSQEAANARVQIDGFPIELPSNDVNDFLPGVNLHLKQAKPDQPFTLTISEDTQKISGKVKTMVDEVNKVLEFIVKQNQIDEKSDTRSTFAGDSTLQNIEYRVRNLLHEGYPVGDVDKGDLRLVHLNEIGVEFQKDGTLSFKEDKFQKALEKDYGGISQAISGELGFSRQLRDAISAVTRGGNGLLATREAGFKSRIREMDRQIEMKQRNLERKQQSLVEQFSRLEASLSSMQRQQQYLSAALPAGGGGGNIVSQLLG